MSNESINSFRRKIKIYRDSSLPDQPFKSSREGERKLDPSRSKYLTTGEIRNSSGHFASSDKMSHEKSEDKSIESLKRSLRMRNYSKGSKKLNKINSKLI
jgi:hypothetical protein